MHNSMGDNHQSTIHQQNSLLITEEKISAKETEKQSLRWGKNQYIFLRSFNAKLQSGKVSAGEYKQRIRSDVEITLLGKVSGKEMKLCGE